MAIRAPEVRLPARGLILEGVTGSGKTRVLEVLLKDPRAARLLGPGRVFPEEETFGELMNELRDPTRTDVQRCVRLRRAMQALARGRLERGGGCGFLLERFHLSYYALMPLWRLYRNIDEGLARLGGRVALLEYPPEKASGRALSRREGDVGDRGRELADYYGSREKAVEAVRLSQERLREAMSLSALPRLVIDTQAMDWPAYAERILEFWAGGSRILGKEL